MKKQAFDLPLVKRGSFAFSQTPITVSDITKRINDLISDENMKKLSNTMLTGWMKEIGLLQVELGADGKNRTVPTDSGRNMGITTEERMGQYGMYMAVVYNEGAQRFILDNLDAVIQAQNMKTENEGKPWSPEDDVYLRSAQSQGLPVKEIASNLQRSNSAIRSRLKKLGIG